MIARYSRHLLMPEVGLAGQRRRAAARVLCVGAGGLGAPVALYLAAAGIGRLGLVDDDTVDITNLQRQVLFATADVGRRKVDAAAERLTALNPEVAIDAYPVRLDAANARDLIRPYDAIVDCTDAFGVRYVLNDAARLEGKPLISGAIYRFEGQIGVYAPGGPCYRCAFPEPPPEGTVPTCAEGGVLGALAGIVGGWQASETLKVVLGIGTPLIGRLALVDALGGTMRTFALARDPACPLCGEAPTIREVREIAPLAAPATGVPELAPEALDAFLAGDPHATLLDVREPHEAVLGTPPGAVAVPASALAARMHELDPARTYVVACRIGVRSQGAARRLRDAGFPRLHHLRGGLLGWAALRAGDPFELF